MALLDDLLAGVARPDLLTRGGQLLGGRARLGLPLGVGSEDRLNALLGLEAPETMEGVAEEPGFEPSGFQRFAEPFAGLQGLAQGAEPQSFGTGLLAGLLGGLGAAGSRVERRRAEFEERAEERRKLRDRENALASQRYREARTKGVAALLKEGREERRRQEEDERKFERENPVVTEALLRAKPFLARQGVQVGDRIPRSVALAEPSRVPAEPLVAIETPEGPRFVTRGEAIGQAPARPQAEKPATGIERQSLAFFNRASEGVTNAEQFEQKMAEASLLRQGQLQYAPNFLQTSEQRRYRQAQRAFTEARLRKESGAAIPESEFANDARTYFAQPGDGPEEIAQKRAARAVVLDGLKFSSGKAYREFFGEDPMFSATPRPSAGGASLRDFWRP